MKLGTRVLSDVLNRAISILLAQPTKKASYRDFSKCEYSDFWWWIFSYCGRISTRFFFSHSHHVTHVCFGTVGFLLGKLLFFQWFCRAKGWDWHIKPLFKYSVEPIFRNHHPSTYTRYCEILRNLANFDRKQPLYD